MLSPPSLETRRLHVDRLTSFGGSLADESMPIINGMTRPLYRASDCGLMKPWLTVFLRLFKNESLWRFSARSPETSSCEIVASGDRSASGCGSVVFRPAGAVLCKWSGHAPIEASSQSALTFVKGFRKPSVSWFPHLGRLGFSSRRQDLNLGDARRVSTDASERVVASRQGAAVRPLVCRGRGCHGRAWMRRFPVRS